MEKNRRVVISFRKKERKVPNLDLPYDSDYMSEVKVISADKNLRTSNNIRNNAVQGAAWPKKKKSPQSFRKSFERSGKKAPNLNLPFDNEGTENQRKIQYSTDDGHQSITSKGDAR